MADFEKIGTVRVQRKCCFNVINKYKINKSMLNSREELGVPKNLSSCNP